MPQGFEWKIFCFFLYEMDRVEDIITMASLKQKIRRMKNSKKKIGRDKSRTHDLSHAKGTRYQLRHTPIFEFKIFG